MKTIIPFDFATVVCDGCACREDSSTINDECPTGYRSLMSWGLKDRGWERVEEDNTEKWYCPLCAKDPSFRTHPGEGRVIIEPFPLYGLKCDHCGREWRDIDAGYTAYADPDDVEIMAGDEDWQEIGGKWYCPDCYQTCKAMSEEGEGVGNIEEVFCSKCKYKDDCNEVEPRTIPLPNTDECSRDCPYRTGNPHLPRCTDSADAKCPRVEGWKNEGMAKQEAANATALAKCNKKGVKHDCHR